MAKSIRVYELAKDLGVDSKEIIGALGQMGTTVKNHMAALDDTSVDALKKRFGQAAKAPPKAAAPVSRPAPPARVPAQPAQPVQPARQSTPPAAARPVQQAAQRPIQQPAQRAPQQVPQRPAQPPAQKPGSPTAQRPPQGAAPRPGMAPRPAQPVGQQRPGQPAQSGQRPGGYSQNRPQYGNRSGGGGAGGSGGGGGGGGYRRYDNRRDTRRMPPAPRPSQPERQTGARHVTIQGPMSVRDLSTLVGIPVNIILRTLMSMGTLISINQSVPVEIAVSVAEKLGCVVTVKEPEVTQEQAIAEELERPDDVEASVSRPPVVTVMGHVDHGKTSLLDAIRDTNVTAREAGGITQHIGASIVEHGDSRIIFLDTPGHEAFTAMRARGAQVTDVAVLVVAADDGVMPQTIEAMNHAKAAGVPIIVALNKIDKPGAKPDRVKQQLSDNGLVPEDWGGDTVVVPVSARTREGVPDLLEMIILVSEMQEIKTDPSRRARGHIIESQMDKGRGPVATALIKAGILRVGDVVVTDTTWGRIRTMYDSRGRQVKKAGPATPVELVGLEEVPQAGDVFLVVDDEKTAKDVTERRKLTKRDKDMSGRSTMTLEDLFAKEQAGEKSDLKVIVKSDVQGSLEALLQALNKLEGKEVKLNVIHSGVGGIIESDVTLAKASEARILGFNVRPFGNAASLAEQNGVEIRTYRVIYDMLDDVSNLLKGLLKPKTEEVILGRIEIRQTFHVPKVGTVAGCMVTDGKVPRSAQVRLLRNGVVIYEGKMASLKRFKDDVSEVSAGYECGLGLDKFQDVKVGDVVEAFAMKEVQPA